MDKLSGLNDVKEWMTANRLKLNSDKTEAMLIGTPQRLQSVGPDSIKLDESTEIPFASCVKNLGAYIDNTLSMTTFIRQTAQSCNYHLRRIASIRHILDVETTTKLVTSLILSRLDYCNSLLSEQPAVSLQALQLIQNNAARLIFRKRRQDHITPLLRQLHWLPIRFRIEYKIAVICHKCIHQNAPKYLKDKLKKKEPSKRYDFRSNEDEQALCTPSTKLSTFGDRSFSAYGPKIWNSLPLSLREISSLESFKHNLKTHLFRKAFQ